MLLVSKRAPGKKPKSAARCAPASWFGTANFSGEVQSGSLQIRQSVGFENKERWPVRTRARYACLVQRRREPNEYRLQFSWNTTTVLRDALGAWFLRIFSWQRPRDPLSHPCCGNPSTGSPKPFL